MAGCLPFHAASRVLAVPSITLATSDSRSTAPLPALITSGAYSAACESWPFTPMVSARSGPSKPPVGSSTLVARMAL